jgi:hypothetical protein
VKIFIVKKIDLVLARIDGSATKFDINTKIYLNS